MLPEERALVERHRKEKFVLLGINSDPQGTEAARKAYRDQCAANGVSWRNVLEGDGEGPIAAAWNVRGWPTVVVLDAKGTIRARYVGKPGPDFEPLVDKLLAEAKTR